MTGNFTKTPHTDEELIKILKARGLIIADQDKALLDLAAYGYHRLGGYRYPPTYPTGPGASRPNAPSIS
ncbi:hypothetical protein [Schaalia vaccimaxillae]|uniref:hypothetical protein n=1 Tax=Schaalia vaccimaxillae TaxID=183916 RepID=UPI00058B892F|nr:hypothetical protein [Schaalia vaccimaxillae]